MSARCLTFVVFSMLAVSAAAAEPMRCSGQYKACAAECAKSTARSCPQVCAARLSACRKTGCWQGANYRACSLLRQ